MKHANYQVGLTVEQAEKLITIGHGISDAAGSNLLDVNARFASLLKLYLDCLALDAMAEILCVPSASQRAFEKKV